VLSAYTHDRGIMITQTDEQTRHTIPSVDAAVSIVLVSPVSEDVPDVLPLATGALGPESVVITLADD